MRNDIKSEARQLPYMLGKVIGGILSAIGIGGFIYSVTRSGIQSHALFLALAGIAGLVIFIVSARQAGKNAEQKTVHSQPKKFGQNALAWVIFIGIVALFIGFIFVFAG